jgi:aminoglycoside phosphotransferase (APT) family kinase protein
MLAKEYLGHLPQQDPLWDYLRSCILPKVGALGHSTDFRVFSMKSAKVYLYEEKHSRALIVGKFFAAGGARRGGEGPRRMQQEFDNLELLRGFGLSSDPHCVVRPLGANSWIDSILVEEFCRGISLSAVIGGAIHQNKEGQLYAKLTALAYFLATLHNRTANGYGVDFSEDCAYLDRLVGKLRSKHFVTVGEAEEMYWLRDRWREQPRMWEDRQVLVHGDATPSNFLFGEGLNVVAIDLERMKRADRVFDVGRIAGELQHFFLQSLGNKYAAEPFIGHFFWEYACHFPDRQRAFRSITARAPFQIALTLLRIARNSWITPAHRRRLIEEAKITLRTF